MFNKNSGLVKVWAKLVGTGVYTIHQVPVIGNLKEMVVAIVGSELSDAPAAT